MYVMLFPTSDTQFTLTSNDVHNLIAYYGTPVSCRSHLGGAQFLMLWNEFSVMTTNPNYKQSLGL